MIPRAAQIFAALEERRQRFLGSLRAMTPEQRAFRARPDAWCPLEVGHHVVLAEQGSAVALERRKGIPSRARGLRYRLGYALLWTVLKTGLRVKNPVPAAVPRRDITLAELEDLWREARLDLKRFLQEVSEAGLEDAAYRHPIGGPFNVGEAFDFLIGHLDHHLRQLERIERHREFPGR